MNAKPKKKPDNTIFKKFLKKKFFSHEKKINDNKTNIIPKNSGLADPIKPKVKGVNVIKIRKVLILR